MSDDVNMCTVDELLKYSQSVEHLIKRINKMCALTAKFRRLGLTCADSEHSGWVLDAVEIYETYRNEHNCIDDISIGTLHALANKLGEANEEKIQEVIKSLSE